MVRFCHGPKIKFLHASSPILFESNSHFQYKDGAILNATIGNSLSICSPQPKFHFLLIHELPAKVENPHLNPLSMHQIAASFVSNQVKF